MKAALVLSILVAISFNARAADFEISAIAQGDLTDCPLINQYYKALDAYKAGAIDLDKFKVIEDLLISDRGLNPSAYAIAAILSIKTPTTIKVKNLIISDSKGKPLKLAEISSPTAIENELLVFTNPGRTSLKLTLSLAGFCRQLGVRPANALTIKAALAESVPLYLEKQQQSNP